MTSETHGNPQILLRLPAEIGKHLLRDAKKRKVTVQTILLEIAATHYGVTVDPPKRGRKSGTKTDK